jgi:phage portal protein BeeE
MLCFFYWYSIPRPRWDRMNSYAQPNEEAEARAQICRLFNAPGRKVNIASLLGRIDSSTRQHTKTTTRKTRKPRLISAREIAKQKNLPQKCPATPCLIFSVNHAPISSLQRTASETSFASNFLVVLTRSWSTPYAPSAFAPKNKAYRDK